MSYQFQDECDWIDGDLAHLQGTVRKFLSENLTPNIPEFSREKHIPMKFWRDAGALGLLGASVPEEYGGSGGDHSFDFIIGLEQGRAGDTGWGFSVHNIVTHYIINFGSETQKQGWLPQMVAGELIGAIAMSEPGAGSDLKAIRTSAIKDGDDYVVNGSKTFITNGQNAGLIVVVCKTDPDVGHKGISLLILDDVSTEGFLKGQNLEKIGLKAQDTSELFFDDVRIPQENLLGAEEGQGFYQLMRELAYERTMLGVKSLSICEAAMAETLEYVKNRSVFGKRLMEFQNTRFKLAECKAKLEALRAFVDKCVVKTLDRSLDSATASMLKFFASEVQDYIVDECLQLHGGYGFMSEYPISRFYTDSRVSRIYGGTSEIQKEIIARSLEKD